jgi:hypothetical protein
MTRSGFSMQWIETTIISRGDEFRAEVAKNRGVQVFRSSSLVPVRLKIGTVQYRLNTAAQIQHSLFHYGWMRRFGLISGRSALQGRVTHT